MRSKRTAELFAVKYPRLVAEVEERFKEGERISKQVMASLEDVSYGS